MAADDQSLRGLVRELIEEVTQLIRYELRLFQAEGREKLHQAQNGLLAIVSGLLLAFAALLVLLQALVVALANFMPDWVAAIVVGAGVALIALALILTGKRNLQPRSLTPERTIQSFRDTREIVQESPR